ncbi:hypothetical protein BLNAU_6054 [Blattamonas nauphoetae]|uniref:Uncharacterized protein n=1 Tax=Blattamonas nauphoetae TaxID=2049346 RepID=A0ABQ9WPT4_9EUKA|nr:hypothetical protein BLNAU_23607 [Blattamonas nauphoetae]KAK2959038.1 hypothetical protein BLNAU_6054 [Blattamonas nauphoetae]
MSAPLPDALGTPPTWIRTKVFTAAPQKPVNSFQTPTHKENNSDLSALVIFRPILAIMVGDIGRVLPVLMRAMLFFTNQMNDEFILISLAFFQSGWKRDAENAKKAMTCASEVDYRQYYNTLLFLNSLAIVIFIPITVLHMSTT